MKSSSNSPALEHSSPGTPDSALAQTIAAEAVVDEPQNDSGKLRIFLGVLRKFIGVKDLASVRFSLPAQLLEPIPNLEYWGYFDRPETFTAIGDSDDSLDRMLEVLRFWCTKDLKFVKSRPCKAYNSTLGEFFRCNWEVDEAAQPMSLMRQEAGEKADAPLATREPTKKAEEKVRVSFLTEQTSHHPPVSAFYVDCPAKGISARGFDQMSAKFTGTSVKVLPGEHNYGIFITLHKRDNEEYQCTHPVGSLGGFLRGGLTLGINEMAYITCPKSRIKTIIHYVEEGWIGRAQNKVDGVIFKYDPENDDKTRVRDVPAQDVLAKVFGNWKDKVYVSFAPDLKTQILLVDLNVIEVIPKNTPPLDVQLPNESQKFWEGVTSAIKNRQYSKATTLKQEIEERQRAKLKERQEAGVEWSPRFFTGAVTPLGRPELTDDGQAALKRLEDGDYKLEPNKVLGA